MLANWKERDFRLNRRQAVFAMLLTMVLAVNSIPALRASALYLITDGEMTTAVGDTGTVAAEQLIVVRAASAYGRDGRADGDGSGRCERAGVFY